MFGIFKCKQCNRIIRVNSDKPDEDKIICISGRPLEGILSKISCICDIVLFHIPNVMTWHLQDVKESDIFEDVTPELGKILFDKEKPNEEK